MDIFVGAHYTQHVVRDIVQTAFERATALLAENRALLDEGARQLLEHETLDESELAALLGSRPESAAAPSS